MGTPLLRQEREKIKVEKTILQHAEDLFKKCGYDNTTMDTLSKKCEYTKRTIYRYFSCKEDLYFAVLCKGHMEMLTFLKQVAKSDQTGKEKILAATQNMIRLYKESNYLFDLMGQINAVRSQKEEKPLPFYQKYTVCVSDIHKEMISFFMAAHNDKSIRTDINPALLGYASVFVTNGFFHMLSLMGDDFLHYFSPETEQYNEFSAQYSLDTERFIQFTMNLLAEGLEDKNISKR